jgi:hypothetical protein
MAAPINYQMLEDPDFMLQMQQALAAQSDIPMQPQVQGIEAPSMSASYSMTEMPKSEKEIQAAIRQRFMEAQAQQEQQIKQQQALLAQEMERQQQLGVLGRLDLRPFAQALEKYGSTTAVVPASAPVEDMSMVEKLREQIQKGQRGLTQDQVNFLRTMMEDRRSAQAALSQGNQDIRVFENVSKKFDKPQQDLADFYQAHDTLKSAIASGDVASIQSSLASYARMTGEKGVLTDQDIGRTITPTFAMSFANLRSKIFSEPNTPVPEETLKTLLGGIERLRKAAEDKTAERINAAERQTSTGPGLYKTYSKDLAAEARKIIRPSEAPQSEMMPSASAIEEELKKRKAK